MSYDTSSTPEQPSDTSTQQGVTHLLTQMLHQSSLGTEGSKKPGRPPVLGMPHLALGILWCFLNGWHSQLELWRFLCTQSIGPFAPVQLSDQAVYNRLAKGGAQAMQELCVQVSACIAQWLAPHEDQSIAPAFVQVLALDESKLDSVKRWLLQQRGVPKGDFTLLAGRLSVLFDVRRQCVRRLDLLADPWATSLVHARSMIAGLLPGTLVLFDLGYYSFEWFDELTTRGLCWVSRIRSNGSFTVQHVLVQREDYREQIVQLGAYRTDHAAFSVRLISLRYQGVWYRYLTNVLDPHALSGAEVARLYARRWDIELAFRTLKDHLHLRMLWSAKAEVIAVQVWATLSLAVVAAFGPCMHHWSTQGLPGERSTNARISSRCESLHP